ncbi:MAG TPA: tRNA (adenosine(37)-N6)-threonylcarbamoyltransferase complex dimerization subunit type 1 TsaB, partial [Actinomycetota bacterium]|nr:tRNA (adenosine(37)-N6)-threonylcarbamoyltransferase complex dimerization subunit type 1 TsaB [Actinomycetota bacterium]
MADRLVLALDTSTVVNVGLARGDRVLAQATIADRMAQVEQLTPAIRDCLSQAGVRLADLGQIVVGLGPGPFTGLRVGVVTARILASVGGVELRGVCSLDVLAAQFAGQFPASDFVVATDARRREVYWAAYDADGRRRTGPAVSPPADVPRRPAVGPAVDLYPDLLLATPGPRALDPGVLAVRGPELPDAGQEPLYLRRPDAAEP